MRQAQVNVITGEMEPSPARNITMATKLDQYEAGLIQEAMQRRGCRSVSEFLREAVIELAMH